MSIEKFYSDIPRIEVTVQEVEKVMEYKINRQLERIKQAKEQ